MVLGCIASSAGAECSTVVGKTSHCKGKVEMLGATLCVGIHDILEYINTNSQPSTAALTAGTPG